MTERKIYMDYSATSPMHAEVSVLMNENAGWYYNPSSVYARGMNPALTSAKAVIAQTINSDPDNLVFTSGGTESDNILIQGWAANHPNGHILVSQIEHPAVRNTCLYIEKEKKCFVDWLPVDAYCVVDIGVVQDFINKYPSPRLICIMGANNEVGTIQPLKEISTILKSSNWDTSMGDIFFSDCVQLYGHKKIDPKELCINALSASAHKFGGPKGVGFLYLDDIARSNVKQLCYGGHQENGFRPGTENVLGIIGMAEASRVAYRDLDATEERILGYNRLLGGLLIQSIPDTRINGYINPVQGKLSGNINLYVKGVHNDQLVEALAESGIYVSAGSACNSGEQVPSIVLTSMGLTAEEANSSIRITLGKYNSSAEIYEASKIIEQNIKLLRSN